MTAIQCARTERTSGQERKFSRMAPYVAAIATGLNILNCSYEGSGILPIPNDAGTGGQANAGGSTNSGGSVSSGGSTSTGGKGGESASGGATSTGDQGGYAGQGGTTSTGGNGGAGEGGAVSSGGTTSSGGAGTGGAGEGGSLSTGGSTSTGGSGGAVSSGGSTSTGGEGGATSTGGAGGEAGSGGMDAGAACPGVFAETRNGLWPLNSDIDVGGYSIRYTGQISGGVQYDIRCAADSSVLESNHPFTQGVEGTVLRPEDISIGVNGARIRVLNNASGPANSNSNVVVEAAP